MKADKSPNRVRRYLKSTQPTPEEIAFECQRIQATRAKPQQLKENTNLRFLAQLRFIQFLTESSAT